MFSKLAINRSNYQYIHNMRVQNQFLISKFAFLKLAFNIKGKARVELHKCLHYE